MSRGLPACDAIACLRRRLPGAEGWIEERGRIFCSRECRDTFGFPGDYSHNESAYGSTRGRLDPRTYGIQAEFAFHVPGRTWRGS